MSSSKYSLTIKETQLDVYGHVNNATYLTLLEEARWEWLNERNYGLDHIQKTKKGPVVLEVNLKYKKEIKVRDVISIETQALGFEGKVGQLKQTMVNQNGDLCAEAIFVFGFFDLAKRKLIEANEEWKKVVAH